MLAALFIAAALADPPAPPPLRLDAYLDEVCADLPEGLCEPLYLFADALTRIIQRGSLEAGSWCCESCAFSEKIPHVTCTGCSASTKAWQCGSVRHLARTVRLDCPGATVEDGSTVSCL